MVDGKDKGLFKKGQSIPKWATSTENVVVSVRNWELERINISNIRKYAR